MLNLNFQNGQAPALNARNMNAIVESINTLGYAVGGPNVASTVSAMTDTSKVYVYTGSETGYTAGNWYYYNGSAWVSGGVYQAAAVETDTTLTMPGEPADAKATGDAVTELKSAIDEAFDISSNLYDPSKDSVGLLVSSNGILYPNYPDYTTSDYIPVNQGDTVRAQATKNGVRYDSATISSGWAFVVVCYYGADKSYISGENNKNVCIVPENAKFLRFTTKNSNTASFTDISIIISNSSDIVPYVPYGLPVNLKEDKIPSSYDQHIKDVTEPVISNALEPVEDIINTFVPSPNIYNSDENVVGLLVASNGNLYPSYMDYISSGYIPVNPGDTIRAQWDDSRNVRHDSGESDSTFVFYTVCFYAEDKSFISGGNNQYTPVAPANTKYFRFSINNQTLSTKSNIAIIISTSGAILPYVAYGDLWYLKEKYIPDSYDEHIKEVVGATSNSIILNIPSKIYAVTGIELNVYFENITEDWEKYQWDVTCTKGKQMARGYSITPSASDVGEYPITIRASIDTNTYKEVSSTLVIADLSTGTGLSVIVLGDSTTDNGQAVEKIHTDFESANTTIQTLGTRGTAPNNHEGRSGWRAYYYVSSQSQGGVDNPFYNPSTSTFDASYYFANSGVSVPDWFIINLGINDVFGYTDDENLNAWIPIILGYYDTMVASLKSAAQSMKIGVCVTIPPNDSQDAFGKAYACSQTRDRAKRNNVIWAEKLIEHFADKESEGIYLVPIHVNLDTIYNMGMESLPVNARNTSVTYQSPIGNGGVHPVESGYWQIADVYTAFLKGNAT